MAKRLQAEENMKQLQPAPNPTTYASGNVTTKPCSQLPADSLRDIMDKEMAMEASIKEYVS